MHEGREISYKYVSKKTKTRLETTNIKINCEPLFTTSPTFGPLPRSSV